MKSKSPGVSIEVAQLVVARDNWSCVNCGRSIAGLERGREWSIHHRIPRGMGGSRDLRLSLPANLIVLCGSGVTDCHGVVERYRTWARDRGLLLWRSQEPDQVAVAVHAGQSSDPLYAAFELYLLDNVGGRKSVDDA